MDSFDAGTGTVTLDFGSALPSWTAYACGCQKCGKHWEMSDAKTIPQEAIEHVKACSGLTVEDGRD